MKRFEQILSLRANLDERKGQVTTIQQELNLREMQYEEAIRYLVQDYNAGKLSGIGLYTSLVELADKD